MDLSVQALVLVGFVSAVGAALGAAIAHWKRGRGHLIVGALIGGLGTFLFAFVATVYAGVIGALSILAVAVLVVFGTVFS
jgi:hypothetical protein